MPAKDPTTYMREYRAAHRQPITPRACQHCDTTFTPQRNDARFCSSVCRSAHRNARIDIQWARLAFLKNSHGCTKNDCAAVDAQWVERRHHVRTKHTEATYYCDEHAAQAGCTRAAEVIANREQW